jgi:sorbitol-specific phosphotransferase system component IIC
VKKIVVRVALGIVGVVVALVVLLVASIFIDRFVGGNRLDSVPNTRSDRDPRI